MPGVAGAVVDPRAPDRAEERQVVGGDVDRPAPRVRDLRLGEIWQQVTEAVLGALDRRAVAREAPVELAPEADRA